MAKNGFKVFDSDMHLVEPADLWERYIDPAYKDRAPKGLSRHPRDLGVQVRGAHLPGGEPQRFCRKFCMKVWYAWPAW